MVRVIERLEKPRVPEIEKLLDFYSRFMVHTESGVEITEGLRNNVELLRLNCATLNTCLRDCFVFLSPGVVLILLALWNPFCMNRTVHMTPFNLERICNQLLRAKI